MGMHYSEIENSWPAEFTETRVLGDKRNIFTAMTLYGLTILNCNDDGYVDWLVTGSAGAWTIIIKYGGSILAQADNIATSGTYDLVEQNGSNVNGTVTLDITNIAAGSGLVHAPNVELSLQYLIDDGEIYREVKNRLLKNPHLPEERKEYLAQLVDKSVLEIAEVYAALMIIFRRKFRVVGDVSYDLYQEFRRRLDDELDKAPIQWDSGISVTLDGYYEESPNVTWMKFSG